jgi:hypothetical protein
MPLRFQLNDPCPRCGQPTMQAEIETHPSRRDLALHNFTCAACGPVKTKIISLTPAARPSEAAA